MYSFIQFGLSNWKRHCHIDKSLGCCDVSCNFLCLQIMNSWQGRAQTAWKIWWYLMAQSLAWPRGVTRVTALKTYFMTQSHTGWLYSLLFELNSLCPLALTDRLSVDT